MKGLYLKLYLLIIAMFHSNFLSQLLTAQYNIQSHQEVYSNFLKPENEDISKRDLYSKHYRVGENRFISVINNIPIRHINIFGTLGEINNKVGNDNYFSNKGYVHRNENNSFFIYFNTYGSKCLITHQNKNRINEYNLIMTQRRGVVSINGNKLSFKSPTFEFLWTVIRQEIFLQIPQSNSFKTTMDKTPGELKWFKETSLIK